MKESKYMKKELKEKDVLIFLQKVDKDFPTSLSKKQDLSIYANKLYMKATIMIKKDGDQIVSLVAGYINNVENQLGYISVVATLPNYRGQGIAAKLIRRFLEEAKSKGLDGVHLYTDKTNTKALNMYRTLGFVSYIIPDETRPEDSHLIYYINK